MSFSEWREVRLGDVCTYASTKVSVSEVSEDNYISTENMLPNKSGVTKSSGLPTVGSVTKYSAGNVLVSNIRPYFRKIWYADRDGGCSNDVLVFDINDSKTLDSKFLFYCLSNDVFFDYVMAGSKGTKMPRGDKGAIMKYPVLLPSLPEQKAIAATLSALDDMIELNNQINKTLEEMAQAIFKSWFVDFEPFKDGEFEESELGLIPKGWRVGVLEDIAFINTETINPQNYPETFFEHFSIPLFDEGKFSAFEKGEVIKSNKYVIDSSCMLFSKLNPQFKRVFRPFCKTSKAICSTEFMVYKAKKPIYNNYIYSTLCSGSFHQFVMQNVTGTTNSRQRAIPKNTLNFKMLIPDENALSSYNQIISGIFNIMQRIPEDNKLLSSIRDTILPKLMTGEIRVPVEEVV